MNRKKTQKLLKSLYEYRQLQSKKIKSAALLWRSKKGFVQMNPNNRNFDVTLPERRIYDDARHILETTTQTYRLRHEVVVFRGIYVKRTSWKKGQLIDFDHLTSTTLNRQGAVNYMNGFPSAPAKGYEIGILFRFVLPKGYSVIPVNTIVLDKDADEEEFDVDIDEDLPNNITYGDNTELLLQPNIFIIANITTLKSDEDVAYVEKAYEIELIAS